MAQWVGYTVSINTKDGGIYQGEISYATENEIRLKRPFSNGIPCTTSEIRISAENIANLNFIKKENVAVCEQSTVTIAKPIPKRVNRSLSTTEVPPKSTTSSAEYYILNKSKPAEVDNKTNGIDTNWMKNGFLNKKDKNKAKMNKRDEACFSSCLEGVNKEFDFEKNLALFDKQAVFEEIDSQRPDIVKNTDNRKFPNKYRHDENVISTLPTSIRQISIPQQESEYFTDDGLIIPSLSSELRNQIFAHAGSLGLTWERHVEMFGRAAADMTLQLLGGARRLNPHNSHQFPTVVIICGSDKHGSIGVNTARQLASHGVKTVVYITSTNSIESQNELSLYKLTQGKIVESTTKLPVIADFIISSFCERAKVNKDVIKWANSNKALVLALDPATTDVPSIGTKFTLASVLPLSYTPGHGKIYLCNLGFPQQIFTQVGIKYKSPFGAKYVIPLHPGKDA